MIELAITDRAGDLSLDLDIALPARGVTGLIGPAGSGKTLLLETLAGFRKPEAGRIALCGRTVVDTRRAIDLPAPQRRIGHVDGDGLLFAHMSVRRNLRFGLPADPRLRARFDAIVAAVELGPLLDIRPAGLSLAERQCAALARALLAAPDLLLLDAPLDALPARDRPQTLTRFARALSLVSASIPVIYASRAADEIRALCTRAIILRDGRAIAGDAARPLLRPVAPPAAMPDPVPALPARFAALSGVGSVIGCPPWS